MHAHYIYRRNYTCNIIIMKKIILTFWYQPVSTMAHSIIIIIIKGINDFIV